MDINQLDGFYVFTYASNNTGDAEYVEMIDATAFYASVYQGVLAAVDRSGGVITGVAHFVDQRTVEVRTVIDMTHARPGMGVSDENGHFTTASQSIGGRLTIVSVGTKLALHGTITHGPRVMQVVGSRVGEVR